jgi:SAM-dependent methyltransferase
MTTDSTCPFCGSKDRVFLTSLQENPKVSLLKCLTCNAASASRIPTMETLDNYYQDYYMPPLPRAKIKAKVTFDNTQRFAHHLAQRLSKYTARGSISILDFGGGDGSIAVRMGEQLLRKGCQQVNITIVDYNTTLAGNIDTRISLTHKEGLDHLSPDYDFVIASAIIEHIPQPKDILMRLLDLLNKGGIFYARTPCMATCIWLCNVLGMKWDFTYPAHIHDLGQDFWESFFGKIFSAVDFSILESKPAIVETSFKDHFLTTCAAYILKAPWYVLGRRYTLVGGWEIFVRKNSDTMHTPYGHCF